MSFTALAEKNADFRTGHLVKVEYVAIPAEPGRTTYKASYLIRVKDGTSENVGLYNITIFGHDYAKELKNDTDIPFRIDGKHLYLKSPEGHEMKALLCQVSGNSTRCGVDVFTDFK
jgi:hypothetical protein